MPYYGGEIHGPPLYDFSLINALPDSYGIGQQRAREDELRQQFARGLPRGPDGEIDWGRAIDTMARTGNLTTPREFAQLTDMAKLGLMAQANKQFQGAILGPNMPLDARAGAPGVPGVPAAPGLPPGWAAGYGVGAGPEPPPETVVRNSGGSILPGGERIIGPAPSPMPPPVPGPAPPPSAAQAPPMPPPVSPAPPVPPGPPETTGTAPGAPPVPPAAPPGVSPMTPPGGAVPYLPTAQAPRAAAPVAAPRVARGPTEWVLDRLPQFMAAAANPFTDPATRQQLHSIIEHALKQTDLTTEQKQYRDALLAGDPLAVQASGFSDWLDQRSRAKSTFINTTPGKEAALTQFNLKLAEEQAKPLATKVANDAAKTIPVLNEMIRLAPTIAEGWAGQLSPVLARFMSSVGMPVPEGARNAEQFSALARQLIQGIRDPGAVSNYEQELYMRAVPGLAMTSESRVMIAGVFKKIATRQRELLSLYAKYAADPDTLYTKIGDMANTPLFTDDERKGLQAAAHAAETGVVTPQKGNAPPPNYTVQ